MESKEIISFLLDKAHKHNRTPIEVKEALEVFFTKEEIAEGSLNAFKKALKGVINEL